MPTLDEELESVLRENLMPELTLEELRRIVVNWTTPAGNHVSMALIPVNIEYHLTWTGRAWWHAWQVVRITEDRRSYQNYAGWQVVPAAINYRSSGMTREVINAVRKHQRFLEENYAHTRSLP